MDSRPLHLTRNKRLDRRAAKPAATTFVSTFLTSRRLAFRTWTLQDDPLALSLWGNPAVTALIGGPFTFEQIHGRLLREIACAASAGVQYWPLFELATDGFVGCCGLRPYRLPERVFELGFHIKPEFSGRGLATEAARTVILHAFNTVGARALFAGHHPDNAASRHILTRLGFRFTHHEHYPPTGLEHPSYILEPKDYVQVGT